MGLWLGIAVIVATAALCGYCIFLGLTDESGTTVFPVGPTFGVGLTIGAIMIVTHYWPITW